jgi:hypothetical protein
MFPLTQWTQGGEMDMSYVYTAGCESSPRAAESLVPALTPIASVL